MNKVILLGRLTKEPEFRYSQTNNILVANFTLAVNRKYVKQGEERQADFINIVAYSELAKFTEIMHLDIENNQFGKPCKLIWKLRHIDNSSLFDKYMASGKQDYSCYEEETIIADYNVFDCYDSQSCKPKFYMGHFDDDIDYKQAEPIAETKEGYIKYLEENDDELPENFYVKRRAS